MNKIYTTAERHLTLLAGKQVNIRKVQPLAGGCINQAVRLHTTAGDYFMKLNDAHKHPGMFEAEAKGLDLLAKAGSIAVPKVFACGEDDGQSFLIMEYVAPAPRSRLFWENFGRSLAALHRHTAARFGLNHDNYIGSLPQSNTAHDNWVSFFISERLEKQVRLAVENNRLSVQQAARFEKLYERLPAFFPEEKPALLHGDLWSGNFLTGGNGEACLIDPAVYYGNREMEIAFTRLFGGFDERFYDAYGEVFPLQPGVDDRAAVCNLYPLLAHVNLFGGGYANSALSILNRFA